MRGRTDGVRQVCSCVCRVDAPRGARPVGPPGTRRAARARRLYSCKVCCCPLFLLYSSFSIIVRLLLFFITRLLKPIIYYILPEVSLSTSQKSMKLKYEIERRSDFRDARVRKKYIFCMRLRLTRTYTKRENDHPHRGVPRHGSRAQPTFDPHRDTCPDARAPLSMAALSALHQESQICTRWRLQAEP